MQRAGFGFQKLLADPQDRSPPGRKRRDPGGKAERARQILDAGRIEFVQDAPFEAALQSAVDLVHAQRNTARIRLPGTKDSLVQTRTQRRQYLMTTVWHSSDVLFMFSSNALTNFGVKTLQTHRPERSAG